MAKKVTFLTDCSDRCSVHLRFVCCSLSVEDNTAELLVQMSEIVATDSDYCFELQVVVVLVVVIKFLVYYDVVSRMLVAF